ncbi:S-locus-specific glycoprotein S13-like [Amaranthus tricolor]|uniref:S-locus-specific glycoprotein S13-like n=1 Tax=Amaranthus tricolor TaxID=29722 RepID=UPI00258E3E05|nr:S-locus-specific glycoprotein S13-like [Amaranthus tricolor]
MGNTLTELGDNGHHLFDEMSEISFDFGYVNYYCLWVGLYRKSISKCMLKESSNISDYDMAHTVAHSFMMAIISSSKCANDCLEEGSKLQFGTSNSSLVSPNRVFELRFFIPEGNSKNCWYLAIWYFDQYDSKIIVWVANRNKPLLESYGTLVIKDGEVKVLHTKGMSYWSADVAKVQNASLCLQNRGNLVLYNRGRGEAGKQLWWQSFNFPTDTILPGMTMVDENSIFTSWKNRNDPTPGSYVFKWQGNKLVVLKGITKLLGELGFTF